MHFFRLVFSAIISYVCFFAAPEPVIQPGTVQRAKDAPVTAKKDVSPKAPKEKDDGFVHNMAQVLIDLNNAGLHLLLQLYARK